MSTRAQALAAQFKDLNNRVIAVVEQCSAADWQTWCPDEGWTVGVVAHHIARAYLPEIACIRAFMTGQPLPAPYTDWQLIDEGNARAAEQHAYCTKAETLELLRRNGAVAVRFIAGLSDEELDHTAFFPLMAETRSTQRMIERILLGHPQEHLFNIQAAVTYPVRR